MRIFTTSSPTAFTTSKRLMADIAAGRAFYRDGLSDVAMMIAPRFRFG